MDFTVQAEHPPALRQALQSDCDAVRYGADLCELKLLNDGQMREFLKNLNESGKSFGYVCPRLPEQLFPVVERHLRMINEETIKPIKVIANDWGILNQLAEGKYPKLIPYLGRQLISIPRRGRPSIADLMGGESWFKRMAAEKVGGLIFDKTNLHYKPTMKFLKEQGVRGAEIDWVPQTFREMKELTAGGFQFSVHLGLVIVAVVRRCHTARYFDEPIPHSCSKPCFKTAFLLKHEIFGELYMDGNTIFALCEPTAKELRQLSASKPSELVITMGSMTRIQTAQDINRRIASIKSLMN
jgi:hypothetical protein